MILKKYFRKGVSAILLVAAASLVYCSKEKEEPTPTPEPTPPQAQKIETPEHLKDWEPQPKVDVLQPYMAFQTINAATKTLTLTLTPAITASNTTNNVWIDVNNDGLFDEKVDVKVTDASLPIAFAATNKAFTVYGNISKIVAVDNALTQVDVRTNPSLKKLNVAQNNLSETSLLSLVKNLPTETATNTISVIVLRDKSIGEREKNEVTETVLKAVKQQKWEAFSLNEGIEELDNGEKEAGAPTVGEIVGVTTTAYNAATVSWTAATDEVTKVEKLKYQVLWKVKESTDIKTSGENKVGMLNFNIENLTEKTTYEVWIKVWNEAGKEASYPPKEFTTPAKTQQVEHYGVWINDKEITSENVLKIDKTTGFSAVEKGTITYSQRKLIIKDVIIKGTVKIATSHTSPFAIELEGNNQITSMGIAITSSDALFIKGNGTLTLTTQVNKSIFINNNNLFFEDGCSIYANGTINTTKDLIINKSEVKVKTTIGNNAFEANSIILKEGSKIISPFGAKNENGKILLNGKACNEVFISHKAQPQTDPDVIVDANTPRVIITTTITKGNNVSLDINAEVANRNKVWIDLNNNGKFDEGDQKVTTFDSSVNYPLGSSAFTIYGAITALYASYNEITAIKFEKNTTISRIGIINNKLSEAALNVLANSLPDGNGKARIVLKSDSDNEKNVVTNDILKKFKEVKHWKTLQIINEKLYSYDPEEEVYGIEIGGVKITADNKDNITAANGFNIIKSGKVTYDPINRVLTLDNVTMSIGEHGNYISFPNHTDKDFTIKLLNTNIFDINANVNYYSEANILYSGHPNGSGKLRITGTGSLEGKYFENPFIACYRGTLIIDGGCRIESGHSINCRNLVIDKAEVGAAYIEASSIELKGGSYIQSPKNATIGLDSATHTYYTIVKANGKSPEYFFISYKDIKRYDIYIAGQQLTSATRFRLTNDDCPNIVAGGSLGYNPDSNTLTLYNVEIMGKEKEGIKTGDTMKQTLNINLISHNQFFDAREYAIYSKNAPINFIGGGIELKRNIYSGNNISFNNSGIFGKGTITSEGKITLNNTEVDFHSPDNETVFKAGEGIEVKGNCYIYSTKPKECTVQKVGNYFIYTNGGVHCKEITIYRY